MTGALSTFSGFFNKALVMGTLLPVLLFVSLGAVFIGPLLPYGNLSIRTLGAVDSVDFLALSFLVLLITGLLYNLNYPIIRAFEGYPWCDSYIGRWRKKRYEREYDSLHSRWRAIEAVLESSKDDKPFVRDALVKLSVTVGMRINTHFPRSRSSVLPTRLGNVVRAFEDYANHQYGISSVTMWPRLQAVVDKEYMAIMDDAKASLDFMLNSCVLSLLSAVFLYASTVVHPMRLASPLLSLPVLAALLCYAATAYLAYLNAIDQAMGWGETVKGAYDLYRRQLLAKLGFEWRPTSDREERHLWDAISRRMLYGRSGWVALPPYRSGTYVRAYPADVKVRLARTLRLLPDGAHEVYIVVQNQDSAKRVATQMTVFDVLPPGQTMAHDSARINDAPIDVAGAGTYAFDVGELQINQQVTIRYQVVSTKKG